MEINLSDQFTLSEKHQIMLVRRTYRDQITLGQNTIKYLDVLRTALNSKSIFTLPPLCCVENSHGSHLKH